LRLDDRALGGGNRAEGWLDYASGGHLQSLRRSLLGGLLEIGQDRLKRCVEGPGLR
jgi:hypothetical protein